MWRYRESYPVLDDDSVVSFKEGITPLVQEFVYDRLVYIKIDYLFPTGSFKDRGASVLLSRIKELGIERILEDSSGNAGCAIAAYGAKAGITTDIYVPERTSYQKKAQLTCYGARVHVVPGNREATAAAALRKAESMYYAGHAWNPLFFHGTKSFAYEICEQLSWKAPDAVIIPTGNGTLLLGAYIGFSELLESGVIDHLPKLIAVQSKHCSPLYDYTDTDNSPRHKTETTASLQTVAEGIAIADPIRKHEMVEVVKKTGSKIITVDDTAVKEAYTDMGKRGYYIEPTSAVAIAGYKEYIKHGIKDRIIVVPLTGSGLKSSLSK